MLRVAGLLALIWSVAVGIDYALTNLRIETWVDRFDPARMQAIDALPIWLMAVWALATALGLAGSVLLLMRSRWASLAFAIVLGGLLAMSLYRITLPDPERLSVSPWDVAIRVIAAGLFVWSVTQRKAGKLR